MAGLGSTAAILQIAVRADTARAEAALRRINTSTRQTAATAQRMVTAQQRQGSAFRSSTASISRYGQSVDRAGKQSRNFEGSTTTLGTRLKNAGKAAAGAAAAYIGIAQAQEALETTTDLATATLGLHQNFGLSIKSASGLGAALVARGGETSTLSTAFNKLSSNVEKAKGGVDSSTKAFAAFGVSVKDLRTLNADQVLFKISDGMESLGRGTKRSTEQNVLFGRSANKELIPALRGGSEALKAQLARAQELGATFEGKGVKGLKAYIAAQRDAKIAITGLQIAFAQALAPALIKVLTLVGTANKLFRNLHGPIKTLINPIGAVIDYFNRLRPVIQKVIEVIGNMRRNAGSAFETIQNAAGKVTGAFNAVRGAAGKMSAPVVDAFHAIKDAADAVVRTVTKVINVFKTAANAPKDLLEKGLDAFGLQKGGGVMVPGHRSGDVVPAYLEPGEVVWNKKAVKAAGGAQRVNQMNKAVPRFAGGGLVGGAQAMVGSGKGIMQLGGLGILAALYEQAKKMGIAGGGAAGAGQMRHYPHLTGDTDFATALGTNLSHMAGALGININVNSGFRSRAEQAALFAASDGSGHMVAAPGSSHHELGIAADISPAPHGKESRFGLKYPMSWEPWHIELARRGGIVQKFAGGGIAGYNRSFPRGGGPAIPFNVAAAIGESVGQPGITVAQIAKGESTLHPGAVSPDGGYGLLQMTPRVQSARTVSAWERIGSYFNPFKNVKMSKLLPMGPSTYFGSQYVTGWNQHYTGTLGKTINNPKPKGRNPRPRTDPADPVADVPAWSLALPKGLTNMIASLGGETGKIATAADFAQRASEFGVPVGGKNEVQWILEELKLMEQLREAYIAMILYIQNVIARFQEAIANAKDQIARMHEGWGKLKPGQKKKRLEEIGKLKAKIGKWTSRRNISMEALVGEEGPREGLKALQGAVANPAFQHAVGLNLADKALWGVFGGDVGAAQSSLKSARELLASDIGDSAAETGSVTAAASTAPDNSALIGLLQDQANTLAQQLYVSEQSFSVLRQTPYAGSFAKGGVVPGPPGAPMLATVHGGETIGAAPVVVVVVEDGAVDARRIRAISGAQAEQMARRAGRGRIPGRAGSMT